MDGGNWEFWLEVTNCGLTVVVLLALALVVGAVGWELLDRKRRWARATKSLDAELSATLGPGSHSLFVPEVGLTMADGGERIEPFDSGGSDTQQPGSESWSARFSRTVKHRTAGHFPSES